MDSSLIIFVLTSGTILFFTAMSILLLVFSSGKNRAISTESQYQNLSKQRIRNKKAANRAVKAYQKLQEEYLDIKIISGHEDGETKKVPLAKIVTKRKRFAIKSREKVAV